MIFAPFRSRLSVVTARITFPPLTVSLFVGLSFSLFTYVRHQ